MSTNSRKFVLEVIERYKAHECLWKVYHPDYRNRDKRDKAMRTMLDFFRTRDPEANLDTVKKKICTLRNCFRKEHNKVRASLENGKGDEEIHVPKLWYYTEMLFLVDEEMSGVTQSEHSIYVEMPFEHCSELSDNESQDISCIDEVKYTPPSQNSADSSSRIEAKRKTMSYEETDFVTVKMAKTEESPTNWPKQQYDSYGQHIAEKLRNLPSKMATYCQKVINDAIFMAETNNLSINAHIVNRNY